MLSQKILRISCLLWAVSLPFPAAAAIGEIFYIEGRVQVKRDAVQKDVGMGYALESGDVVLTGAKAQARLRLNDDSYFALPGNSTFKIDQFSMAEGGRQRKPSTAIFSLLRGGLRTVSGLVGSWSKDTYQLNTPVVTMGIRGTEYSVIYCNNSCPPAAANGGYIEVLGGSVNASNKEGAIDLQEGQWGEVRSPPRRVLQRPIAFTLDTSGVFDPSVSITARAKITGGGPAARVNADIRIERPASPSEPAPQ